MNEKIKYSEQWDISAQYFYNKGYYSWMADGPMSRFSTS